MADRTPGPWEVAPDRWWAVRSIQDQKTIVSAAVAGRSMEEELANARFIAAAPDLLEALEKIVLEFEGYASDGLDLAIAAIAKAEGE